MKIARLDVGACLELKAAGFPQEDCSGYWTPNAVYDNPREPSEVYHFTHDEETEFDAACPTSDELLAVLGHISFFVKPGIGAYAKRYQICIPDIFSEMRFWEGDTFAEALAALYLKGKEANSGT